MIITNPWSRTPRRLLKKSARCQWTLHDAGQPTRRLARLLVGGSRLSAVAIVSCAATRPDSPGLARGDDGHPVGRRPRFHYRKELDHGVRCDCVRRFGPVLAINATTACTATGCARRIPRSLALSFHAYSPGAPGVRCRLVAWTRWVPVVPQRTVRRRGCRELVGVADLDCNSDHANSEKGT